VPKSGLIELELGIFKMAHLLVIVSAVVCVLGITSGRDIITSPEVSNWGTWAKDFERCPEGRAAQGFQVLSEPWTLIDNTCMNGLRLDCGNPADGVTPSITSDVGPWGKWGNKFRCSFQGYITGFQLRVEKPNIIPDETATNNIRVFCSLNEGETIEGDGESRGEFGTEVRCPAGQVVCGIRTQIQEDRGNFRKFHNFRSYHVKVIIFSIK